MPHSKRPKRVIDYYIMIHKPDHHRAVAEGYVAEQILVAENILGRQLSEDEEVRHINGNTQDNRPQNLEIISSHGGYRVTAVETDSTVVRKSNSRTFIPCKFQKPCWRDVRAPIARANKIFLPHICSWQEQGDIYKCSHFWKFVDKELEEQKGVR